MLLLLLACADKTPGDLDTGPEITETFLRWSTDPDPLQAGEEGTFTIEISDQLGRPVEDLQENHERMVHTIFISADWSTFAHLHHEDYAALNAEDLRQATFHFPLTLPAAGDVLLLFGYAHRNQWIYAEDHLLVEGSPAQAAAPDTTVNSLASADGLVAELTWSTPPVAGYEASWTITVYDAEGAPVQDLAQTLGADAHCALVNEDLSWGSHTHAWFPDMDNMAPGMDMPHLYTGPDLPFVYSFPAPGTYKMWVQVARDSAPGLITTLPFVFEVDP